LRLGGCGHLDRQPKRLDPAMVYADPVSPQPDPPTGAAAGSSEVRGGVLRMDEDGDRWATASGRRARAR
jgi:hypothetical protein